MTVRNASITNSSSDEDVNGGSEHKRRNDRDEALSPSARQIAAGVPFGYDHETEWVEKRESAAAGPLADRLTIARFGSETDATSISTVVISVKLLESRIAAGVIFMIFAGCARAYNERRGWRPAQTRPARRSPGRLRR